VLRASFSPDLRRVFIEFLYPRVETPSVARESSHGSGEQNRVTSRGRRKADRLVIGERRAKPRWASLPVRIKRPPGYTGRAARRAPGPTRMTGDEKWGSARLTLGCDGREAPVRDRFAFRSSRLKLAWRASHRMPSHRATRAARGVCGMTEAKPVTTYNDRLWSGSSRRARGGRGMRHRRGNVGE
jgi:hypothetical protein